MLTFDFHLPHNKLTRLQVAIHQWVRKRKCTLKELESFLGHLSHAATVVPQGRVFLRQLFSLLSLSQAPHHCVRLNLGARADLAWWQVFLNGKSFPVTSPTTEVFSDAAGTFGCRAFTATHHWLQITWPDNCNGRLSILQPRSYSQLLWQLLTGVLTGADNGFVSGPSADALVALFGILCCLF